jgi:hypothetical protein
LLDCFIYKPVSNSIEKLQPITSILTTMGKYESCAQPNP